jgi:hypothetical protein
MRGGEASAEASRRQQASTRSQELTLQGAPQAPKRSVTHSPASAHSRFLQFLLLVCSFVFSESSSSPPSPHPATLNLLLLSLLAPPFVDELPSSQRLHTVSIYTRRYTVTTSVPSPELSSHSTRWRLFLYLLTLEVCKLKHHAYSPNLTNLAKPLRAAWVVLVLAIIMVCHSPGKM